VGQNKFIHLVRLETFKTVFTLLSSIVIVKIFHETMNKNGMQDYLF